MRTINLANVQEFADFKRPVGGFVLEIKAVEDVADREYLRVAYDIVDAYKAEDKSFVGMYTKRQAERGFDLPTTVISYKKTALPMFKGFISAVDKSNGTNFEAEIATGFDEKKLVSKRFGAVLGEEEYEGKDRNGAPKVKVKTNIVNRRSVEAIMKGEFKIPELKKLEQTTKSAPSNPFAQSITPQQNPFAQAQPATYAPQGQTLASPAPTPTGDTFDEVPF